MTKTDLINKYKNKLKSWPINIGNHNFTQKTEATCYLDFLEDLEKLNSVPDPSFSDIVNMSRQIYEDFVFLGRPIYGAVEFDYSVGKPEDDIDYNKIDDVTSNIERHEYMVGQLEGIKFDLLSTSRGLM